MIKARGGRARARGLAAYACVLATLAGCNIVEKLSDKYVDLEGAPEAAQLALVEFEEPVADVVAAGNYAFLLHKAGGFSVVELSDEVAAKPKSYGPFATPAKVLSVAYDERSQVAYVADASGTILVVDLTAGPAIRVVSSVQVGSLAVEGAAATPGAIQLARSGKRLFALKGDVLTPINVNKLGTSFALSPEKSTRLPRAPKQLAAGGGHVYLGFDRDGEAEVEAWKTSLSGELVKAGTSRVGGELKTLLARGSKVLVLAKQSGLSVVDFYKSSAPRKVYENDQFYDVASARLFGRTLVVGLAERELVSTLDVSDFAAPAPLTTNKGSLPAWIALIRGNLFMGDATRGSALGVNPVLAAGVPQKIRDAFPRNGQIPLTFSKPIDPASLTSGAIKVRCGDALVEGTPWLSPDRLTVNFRPASALAAGKSCTIDFSGLNGLNDLPLFAGRNGGTSWTFQTASEAMVPKAPGSAFPHTADGKFTGCFDEESAAPSADAGAPAQEGDAADGSDKAADGARCEWFDVQPAQGRYTYFYADFDGSNLWLLNDWFYNGENIDPDCYNEFQAWTGGGSERWTIRAFGDQHVEVTLNGAVVDATTQGVEGGAFYGPSPNVAEPHTIYELKIPASAGSWGVQLHDPGPTFACNHLEAETAPLSGSVVAGQGGGSFDPNFEVAAPRAPSLVAPVDGSANLAIAPELSWSDDNGLESSPYYRVEIASDAAFTNPVVSATTWQKSYAVARGLLAAGTTYHWRVTAQNQAGAAASEAFTFTTTATPEYFVTTAISGQGSVTSADPVGALNCSSSGGTCQVAYAGGAQITLTATPAQGWMFSGWSGACAGAGVSTTLDVESDLYCIANFTAPNGAATLWASTYGNGSGVVSSVTPGVSCGSDCNEVYAKGTPVTLTATPSTGSVFAGWFGDCSGSAPTLDLTMDADKYCTAIFNVPPSGKLTLSVWSSAGGSVTSNIGGINCPSGACQQSYDPTSRVRLTARPASGYAFQGWTGDCAGAGSATNATVTLDAHKSCGATFVSNMPALSVYVSGPGSVTSLPSGITCTGGGGSGCSANFARNATVELTARPSGEGTTFVGWQGDCSGSELITSVTLDAAKSCTAVFSQSTLSVSVIGSGNVTSAPSGINCGSGQFCSANYAAGTEVTLTAAPAANYAFTGWSGSCSGSELSTTVSVSGATYCTATFATNTLSVYVSGSGSVSSSPVGISCSSFGGGGCTASYASATEVQLSAAPAQNYIFSGWSGCSSSTSATISVNVAGTQACTALFVSNQNTLSIYAQGNGSGSVSSEPTGVSCSLNGGQTSGSCTPAFGYNQQVTLTATPASSSDYFSGWSGACSGTSASASLTMTGSTYCYASFQRNRLSVGTSGSGSVSSDVGGISCSSGSGTCSADYAVGSEVQLTATPGQGYVFAYWGGCSSSSSATITVTQSRAQSCTAYFTTNSLTTYVSGSGTVTSGDQQITCSSYGGSGCSANYATYGQQVQLTATPAQGQAFVGWSGCSSSNSASISVTMQGAQTCYASFASNENTLSIYGNGNGSGSVTSQPTGVSCTSNAGTTSGSCAPVFAYNQQVTLTATPATSSDYFGGWSGWCSGTSASANVTLAGARYCYATFTRNRLTVSSSGPGSVTSNLGSINCVNGSGSCASDYAVGTQVQLTATPADNYVFASWSGCSSSTSPTITITQNTAQTCTAIFTTNTLATYVSGTGSVTSSDSLINCASYGGSGCAQNYATYGQQVQLTATPGSNQAFVGWSGCSSSTNATITVTLNGSQSCYASFQPNTLTTYVSTGAGTITSNPGTISCTTYGGSNCANSYAPGTVVQLTASPATNYSFTGWSGGCSGTNPVVSVTMNGTRSCFASFATNTLSVDLYYSGYAGGSVTSSAGGISCTGSNTGTCSANFASAQQVTLTAAPASGYVFTQWLGDCSGTNPVTTVTTSGNRICYPQFSVQTYATTVNVVGRGGVTSSSLGIACGNDCSHTWSYNTSITLTATPAPGETFLGWSGGCEAGETDSVFQFQMPAAPVTCTATFSSDGEEPSFSALFSPLSYDAGICSDWDAFRTGLSAATTYDVITIRSSLDPNGVSCTGSAANSLCQALRSGGSVSNVSCGGRVWDVGACGGVVELHAGPSSGVCSCGGSGQYTVRPCYPYAGYTASGYSCGASQAEVLEVDCGQIELSVAVTGSGSVTSQPSGISCPGDCTESLADGTSVTLTATPAQGETFLGWSGDCASFEGPTATVEIVDGAPVSCTAAFSSNNTNRVLILAADDQSAADHIRSGLIASGAFTSVDTLAGGTINAPTLAALQAYDVVLVWTRYLINGAIGDLLADYYDGGGRVVVATFATGGYSFSGRFATSYLLLNAAQGYGSNCGTPLASIAEPSSPLLSGVSSVTAGGYCGLGTAANGGTVVASWSNGYPFIVRGTIGGRKRVDLNFFPHNGYGMGGDAITLIRNALLYK